MTLTCLILACSLFVLAFLAKRAPVVAVCLMGAICFAAISANSYADENTLDLQGVYAPLRTASQPPLDLARLRERQALHSPKPVVRSLGQPLPAQVMPFQQVAQPRCTVFWNGRQWVRTCR